ncbi:hypothetical protein [Stappia indica]|uniref:Uncharacterized protein n=1 Tax=Stappia indica TaxID=538381 RepID=A0A285TTC4_9HYPH|nr:hypothetical protein [Stappia indica]SOC26989.1 hypothetical protein SAMN05421512_11736 [Stappia indica]
MLSDDIQSLRAWIDAHVTKTGGLTMSPMVTRMMQVAVLDMAGRARHLEASRIAGPATITDGDLASGKVQRLPIVPRPVPAAPDGGGSAA